MKRPIVLSDNQMNFLYLKLKNNGLYYHDLQIEIGDHLACMIEEEWRLKPDYRFEEIVIHIMKRDFGQKVLKKITKQREKNLNRFWVGRLFKEMMHIIFSKFLLPTLLLLIGLIGFNYWFGEIILKVFQFTFPFAMFYLFFRKMNKMKNIQKYLVVHSFYNQHFTLISIFYFLILMFGPDNIFWSWNINFEYLPVSIFYTTLEFFAICSLVYITYFSKELLNHELDNKFYFIK